MYKIIIPKFLMVGSLGTITNTTLFYILVDILGYQPIIISVMGFFIASIQNYTLNHLWTFAEMTQNIPISIKYYIKYLCVALLALGVNLIVLQYILVQYTPEPKVLAQALGILMATIINFLGTRAWVFNAK